MAQFLNSYQVWLLSVKNAIRDDQPIPVPPGSPPMSRLQRDLWQTHVRQSIHDDVPMAPLQWMQDQDSRRSAPTSAQIWGDVVSHRQALAAQAAAQDGGAA